MKTMMKRRKKKSKKKESIENVNNKNRYSDMSLSSSMTSEMMNQLYEGQLYKYTNVMKGWQFRWFILDPITGVLYYYLSEHERRHQPRGWVHLHAAVISPSEEDSNTFTVNSHAGEIFKLRAQDAKARQEWVNRLRAVSQSQTPFHKLYKCNEQSTPREQTIIQSNSMPSTNCHVAIYDAFSAVREHIEKAENINFQICRTIDDLPSNTGDIRHVDPELLMLKAAAQSTLTSLSQCLYILQQQTTNEGGINKVVRSLSKHEHNSSKKKNVYAL